jgi:protein-disulfide isomerase
LAEKMVASFQKNATKDGISSTPSFLINGKLVRNLPYEELKEMIEKNLE